MLKTLFEVRLFNLPSEFSRIFHCDHGNEIISREPWPFAFEGRYSILLMYFVMEIGLSFAHV